MEQTLAAAHALFAERGYAAVKMDEIAASVGVTKPLLYNYFGNKEQLYISCMERAGDSLTATVAEAVADQRQPRARRWAPASAPSSPSSTATAPPGRCSSTRPSPAAARSPTASPTTAARIVELVSGSMLAQLPADRRDAARIEIEALSTALLGAAEALARWWLRTQEISADEAAELLISTIEPGLRARSGAPTLPTPPTKGTTNS